MTRVRFVEFRDDQAVNLPGRQGARNAHAFDPEHPERHGYDLSIDFERGLLRYVVPEKAHARLNGSSRWMDASGPVHGQGPVGYLPLGVVKRFELVEDAEADAKKPAKVKP